MDKLSLFVRARRMVACVSGGSFMASHRLGRRISDCVVASTWLATALIIKNNKVYMTYNWL